MDSADLLILKHGLGFNFVLQSPFVQFQLLAVVFMISNVSLLHSLWDRFCFLLHLNLQTTIQEVKVSRSTLSCTIYFCFSTDSFPSAYKHAFIFSHLKANKTKKQKNLSSIPLLSSLLNFSNQMFILSTPTPATLLKLFWKQQQWPCC